MTLRHLVRWGAPAPSSADYICGLGEMYVTDPRFAANYGGRRGAELVRAALDERLSRSS